MAVDTQVQEAEPHPVTATRRRGFVTEHWPFLVALVAAAALRVVVQVAFGPAIVQSDGPTYLNFLGTFTPISGRPASYGLLLLYPLAQLTTSLVAVTVAQHVIGLLTAVLLYALLRRWRVNRWVAALATFAVLFDSLQLILEQNTLTDTLFTFFVLAGAATLTWTRRPVLLPVLLGGIFLGASATVRLVGEPLVVAGVFYCLLAARGWRRKIAASLVVVLGFMIPVGAYATWYHSVHGVYALAQFEGKTLYMRTTTFVDCAAITVPDYERVLCPRQPLGQRLDPQRYGFSDPHTIPALKPPRGVTKAEAEQQFAVAAIKAQPGAYLRTIVRDFFYNFNPTRTDRYEYKTADKWTFKKYVHPNFSPRIKESYAAHGGVQLQPRQPYARALVLYQKVGYTPGPLLLTFLVLGLVAGLGVGRARRSGMRAVCLFFAVTGAGMLLTPAVTGNMMWRYQEPALPLLPAAAALGFTALTRRPEPEAPAGRRSGGGDPAE